MTSCVNQQMPVCEKKQLVGCNPRCNKATAGDITFDAEFSLPCGFFKTDFLDNYDTCEPQLRQMQTKGNLFHHQA